jgi:hypothetical protein
MHAFCSFAPYIGYELFFFTDADDPIEEKVVEKPAEEMNDKEQWAVFFRYLTDRNKREKINKILEHKEGIAMASEVLMTISRDEIERLNMLSDLKAQLDAQDRMVHAKRMGLAERSRGGNRYQNFIAYHTCRVHYIEPVEKVPFGEFSVL